MQRSIVAIGNFDGVHRGHQALLSAAQQLDLTAPLCVVTFWPHPAQVVRPGQAPKLLTDLHDRIELLRQAGAAEVRVVQFTEEVAAWSPEEFVHKVLTPFNPAHVVVGENFRFGCRAAGDVDTLRELSGGSYRVTEVDLLRFEGAETCSTLIRQAVLDGDVELAGEQLGHLFRVRGVVVVGDQRGRELGYPTANLPVSDQMAVPADGVYAGWLKRLDQPGAEPLPAAISVGTNPTFDGHERRVESYVLDRTDLELYGVEIAVEFVARLRGQVKFDGLDALIDQMADDVQRTRTLLRRG